jgi:hypothetical protein
VQYEISNITIGRAAWETLHMEPYLIAQPVPHRKHTVSTKEPNRLMLFTEIIADYCEVHTKYINIFYGQTTEFNIIASD